MDKRWVRAALALAALICHAVRGTERWAWFGEVEVNSSHDGFPMARCQRIVRSDWCRLKKISDT